jgi:transposase
MGLDADLYEAVSLCQRMDETLLKELVLVESSLFGKAQQLEDVRRLMTIPSFGIKVATVVYATIGDVHRFPDARSLGSYAGLVPSVSQSGARSQNGHITKEGSSQMRAILTQAGHVLLWRCKNDESRPLKNIVEKIQANRMRRKIAVVAAARHLLRIAFYVLRDGTTYDPTRLATNGDKEATQAA